MLPYTIQTGTVYHSTWVHLVNVKHMSCINTITKRVNSGYTKHPHNKTHTVKGVTGGGATNLGLVNRLVTVYRKFQVRCQKILTHAHNLYAQQVLEQRTCTCWQRTGNFLYQHFKGRCDSLVYQILPSPFYPHFIYNIPFMGVFYSSYPLWIVWVNGLNFEMCWQCVGYHQWTLHRFPAL